MVKNDCKMNENSLNTLFVLFGLICDIKSIRVPSGGSGIIRHVE